MKKITVAGNWKMNLALPQAESLILEIADYKYDPNKVKIIVAPSFPFLYPLKRLINGNRITLAAQNMHYKDSGAYTGEVSADMLKSIGIDTVILGHSERRQYFCETPEILKEKVDTAVRKDMQIIFCVGENKDERENGKHFDTVKEQLEKSLFHLPPPAWKKIGLAYEPVWAIGTGLTATPGQAQEMHGFIRQLLSERYDRQTAAETTILYGGSVKPGNAGTLFGQPDVDGGLIGGASLKAGDFIQIIQTAESIY